MNLHAQKQPIKSSEQLNSKAFLMCSWHFEKISTSRRSPFHSSDSDLPAAIVGLKKANAGKTRNMVLNATPPLSFILSPFNVNIKSRTNSSSRSFFRHAIPSATICPQQPDQKNQIIQTYVRPQRGNPRITRTGWSEPILEIQQQLLDHYAADTYTWKQSPITLPNGHTINLAIVTPLPSSLANITSINEKLRHNATLTLIHGWGSGLGLFARSLQYLAPHFKAIYLVDLPGMAASSRPTFPRHDLQASLLYFLNDLQNMHTILSRTDSRFRDSSRHIAAHSLAGYLTAEWLIRHQQTSAPDQQKLFHKLYLLSPVGIPHRPKRKKSFSPYRMFIHSMWAVGCTPQDVSRIIPSYITRQFLAHFVRTRFVIEKENGMNDYEQKLLMEYCFRVSIAPAASERAMSSILTPGAWAAIPLCDRLPLLHEISCTFLYGEKDWMDWKAGEKTRQEMKVPTRLIRLKDSDHNFFLDNAKGFALEILKAANDFENDQFTN